MSSPLREVLSRRPEPSVEEFFDDPDSFQLPPGFFDSSPERSVSRIMDVVSFVLRETGMPPTHRAFVDALIGVADGRLDWFEASDFTIGKRARPKTDIKRESIESWTMRARKRFVKWQETFGITIIECMPGGKLNGENFTSRYRLPVLEIAAEVIKQATGHPLWQTQPERAIRRATQETIKKHGGGLHGVARQERFTRNMPDIDQFEKTFLAYGRKVTGQAMLRSEDPRQRLDRVYRQLMAELIPQDDHVQSSLLIQEETVHGESGEWVTDLSPIAPVSNQKGDKLVTLPVNSVKRHETPPGRLAEMAADAFGSVGANISLAVFLDDSKPKGEQKTWDLTFGSVAAFKVKIPALLERSEMKRESMAARVTGDHIVHLDDCDTQDELRLRGFSFLTVMTSPGNFQCWLALAGVEIGHRDEIRERLINKLSNTGSTANRGSSGRSEEHTSRSRNRRRAASTSWDSVRPWRAASAFSRRMT